MMEKDFKFESIGKQTPYRTPDDFFEKMQNQLMEQALKSNRKLFRMKVIFAAIASVAAMLAGFLFFISDRQQTDEAITNQFMVSTGASSSYSEMIDLYVEGMSDEELAEWIEFSENDIFINLN